MTENNKDNVRDIICEYLKKHRTKHHRYKSWEHCYSHFQKEVFTKELYDKDYAALMLGFYLASWGMYRGSSKLLTDYTYTIHKKAIKILKKYKDLKDCCEKPEENRKKLNKCCEELKKYYHKTGVSPTPTLISKIILGTHGVLPAFDDYFCKGLKGFKEKILLEPEKSAFSQSRTLVEKYTNIKGVLEKNKISPKLDEFVQIAKEEKLPLAKIIDMYFWELGRILSKKEQKKKSNKANFAQ